VIANKQMIKVLELTSLLCTVIANKQMIKVLELTSLPVQKPECRDVALQV
jgi:hypothetical protein